MRHAGDEDFQLAMKELVSLLRICELWAHSYQTTECPFRASLLIQFALTPVARLLRSLNSDQIASFLAELEQIEPLPIASKVINDQRLFVLDQFLVMWEGRDGFFFRSDEVASLIGLNGDYVKSVDPNSGLETINRWFDGIVLEEKLGQVSAQFPQAARSSLPTLSSPKDRGNVLADSLLDEYEKSLKYQLWTINKARISLTSVRVQAGLESHRLSHGRYPASLSGIVTPAVLDSVATYRSASKLSLIHI